jgi:pyruvate kinase
MSIEIDKERRTKIVATIGPASSDPVALRAVLAAGVDVVRLNLSHGPVAEHLERLAAVRAAATDVGRVVAVLADLPGPKVRAGSFGRESAQLVVGESFVLVPGNAVSTSQCIEVDYPTLLEDLSPGDRIVIGDGAITARITAVDGARAVAQVLTGGRVAGRPGVHLPATRLRLRTPTAEDLVLARTMAEAGVDFLAVSFVRTADDMRAVEAAVSHVPDPPMLVAKIETGDAAGTDLLAIIKASDAVMVARGDLGIDCDLADVPHIQKRIIRTCVESGVPVITATQMLETMITSPSPTRAEVSDVANAVFDGTDAVMLSGETAVGHDPALVVRTMSDICKRAEQQASYRQWASRLGRLQRTQVAERRLRITQALGHAAWQAAEDAGADALVCCTRSGDTARAMARYRPLGRLIAASPQQRSVNCLALSWGVTPLFIGEQKSADDMIWVAVEAATKQGLLVNGDLVVALAGTGSQRGAPTDLARIIEIRDLRDPVR